MKNPNKELRALRDALRATLKALMVLQKENDQLKKDIEVLRKMCQERSD